MPERHTGTVAKWLNHKGIGFITPDGAEGKEGEDILVHFQQIKQETEDGFKSLEQGAKVEYTLEQDPKDATKSVAVNVTGPEGADCPPKTKGSKGSKGSGKRSKGKGKGKKGSKGKGKGKKKEDGEEEAEE